MIYSLEKEGMARFISLYKEIDCLKVHNNCCLLSERHWNFNIPGVTFFPSLSFLNWGLQTDTAYLRMQLIHRHLRYRKFYLEINNNY